jgi:hypothetical protein
VAKTKKELRQFLLEHSREQLSEWLLGVAKDSPDFRQRLDFYAGTHQSFEVAAKAIEDALDGFNQLSGQRRTLKPAEIAKSAQFLLESMRACLDFAPTEHLLPLVESAMVALDRLLGSQGKSSTRLEELQREFGTFHLRVAKLFPGKPEDLAERLFTMRSNAAMSILPESPKAYVELLGAAGLRKYRELLEPLYQVVVNHQGSMRPGMREAKTFLNRRVMLFEWLLVSEDVDEQVAIMLAMARHAEEVLTVANYLDLRERPMDALLLVQKSFAKAANPKLARFLADRYERQSQSDEALPLRWYLFEQKPDLDHFNALMHTAGLSRQSAEWRERAMAYAAEHSKGLHIELLLKEDRLEDALSQARVNGAPITSWAKLAEGYSVKDPRLAIELYFDCAEFALKEKRPSSFIPTAWQLAVDSVTFQVFNSRLRALFGKEKLPDWYVAKLVEAGIPVAKLLQ